ncbi:MAG: hypothetical protein EZS28_039564, partial [Streblomastix strix]
MSTLITILTKIVTYGEIDGVLNNLIEAKAAYDTVVEKHYKQWKEEDKPADGYRHFIKFYLSPLLKERGYTVAQVYSVIGGRIWKGVIAPWILQYYDKSYQAQSFIGGDATSLAIYKKLSKAIKQAYNQYFITGRTQQRDNQTMLLIQISYAAFWNSQLGEIPDDTNNDGS